MNQHLLPQRAAVLINAGRATNTTVNVEMSAVEQTFCFWNVSGGHGNVRRAVTKPDCRQMLRTFSVT